MARWSEDSTPAAPRVEIAPESAALLEGLAKLDASRDLGPALSGPEYVREQSGIVVVETLSTPAAEHRARCDGVLMAPVFGLPGRRSCNVCDWSPDDAPDPDPPAVAPRPVAKRKAPAPKRSAVTGSARDWPTVTPAPGAEAMYAEWQQRGVQGVSRWHWDRNACSMVLKRKRPDLKRTRPAKGRHELDIAWRKANPDCDAFLARCEVAGRILRRWAIVIDGELCQHLELPADVGSLMVGEVLEWSAERIAANAPYLAGAERAAVAA